MAEIKAPVAAPKKRGRVAGAASKPLKEVIGLKVSKIAASLKQLEAYARKQNGEPLDPVRIAAAKAKIQEALDGAIYALGQIQPKTEGVRSSKSQEIFQF